MIRILHPGILRQSATVLIALTALLGATRGASTADLVEQGNAAYQQGKLDEALALYDEASVTAPESPQLHFNRGTVQYQKENFADAIDSFKKAALRSKDLDLAARAKYNLGNCAFRNGQRQRDSDLKKAIEHCEESISYYQEAHGMDSEFSKAAENIEIVRLYVKTLLDEQKQKQEEQQQQQDQQDDLVKKLQELIKRQNALMSENEELRAARPDSTHPAAEAWRKALDKLTGKEGTLRGDTGKVLVEMRQSIEQIRQQAAGGGASPGGAQPSPAAHPDATGFAEKLEQASGHVGNAMADEQLAEDHLAAVKQESALAHQANAVADLEEAIKVLSEDQQQQQDQQEQSDDQNQEQQDQQDQEQQDQDQQEGEEDQDQQNQQQGDQEEPQEENQQQQEQSQGEESEEEQEEREAEARAEQADDILDEEKDNQKKRQPARPGRVRPVDKDW